MDPYDRLRGAMGFPVDYELGQRIMSGEHKRTAIFGACKNYVVKLECQRDDVVVGFFNGYMYCDDPLILTAGHVNGYDGATKVFACFYEGTILSNRVELELIKVGNPLGSRLTSTGVIYNAYDPDCAVYKSPTPLPAASVRPYAATASVGDTSLIVGFKGKGEPQLSFSDGHVAYAGLSVLQVTNNADNGYSGSPVFNSAGFIIGMVQGEEGTTFKHVNVVPATIINQWLLLPPGCPAFKG